MYPRPISPDNKLASLTYQAFVALILILWLLPLFAVMLTASKAAEEIMAGKYWTWPEHFNLVANFQAVFQQTNMWGYFVNSLIITLPSVLLVLILSTLTGYVLARYNFRGNALVFSIFVGGNFLPAQIMMIPVRDMMVGAGLYDTYFALIVFHVAFQTGFATLFMRNFIAALPDELFQAAKAEGASPWQTMRHVVIPLMRPALAALAILVFTFVWNDYFWAIVLTQSDVVKPVTAGLNNLRGEWTSAWNIVAAATLFVAVPPVTMFFLMQKHFIAGLTMGAVKG